MKKLFDIKDRFSGKVLFSLETECVEHLARCSCNCQMSAPDVEQNRHIKSCIVGKAQEYLGQKVTEKPLWR